MSGVKVLLADDHAILRSGIIRLLEEEEDIKVVGEAGNGREAVQKVQDLRPDVVLMDIGMPVMNGMEATREIRKRCSGVKVLMLTVHDNEEYLYRAFEAGAAGYLLKQAADTDLVSAIHAVARGDYFLYPSITRVVVDNYLERHGSPSKPSPRSPHHNGHDTLTDRELEIMKLLAEGYINREIAEELYISIKTVESHKAHIMDKLKLRNRAELVKYAIRNGILRLDLVKAKESAAI